ncbi:MAG: tyrosine-type recombinase/integrase [Planctomycetes bacterium]|nr:tyrosine-type recombinase/integrase [Planctomycetota bacterium]MBL7008931.1 tyrosine-type recombinase/integrase [Planctomycetota bacterium]
MSTKPRRSYLRRPHLWRRPDNGILYILFHEDGLTRKKSTRTRKRAEAEDALRQFEAERAAPRTEGRCRDATIQGGIKDWLADRERPRHGLDEKTLIDYRRWAKNMLAFFSEDRPATEVGRADVRRLLDYLEDNKVSRIQMKRHLTALSMVFNFLITEEAVAANPCHRFRFHAQTQRHRAMPEKVYREMILAMEEEVESASTAKYRALATELLDISTILWFSGLRYVEAIRLRWEDVDLDRGIWTIRSPRNKGGTKTIPMHDEVVRVLQRRRLLGKDGPFSGRRDPIQRSWARFRKRHEKFGPWKFHCMRHSFVSRVRQNFSDVAAKELARHGTATMMDHYTHVEDSDLRAALEAL